MIIMRDKDGSTLPRLLATPDAQWLDLLAAQARTARDWRALAKRGGFPTPALHLATARHLRTFRAEYRKKARAGLLLH
jgi:hypothetical protein